MTHLVHLFPPPPQRKRPTQRRPRKPRAQRLDTPIGLDPVTVAIADTSVTIVFRDWRPEFDSPAIDEEHALRALGAPSPVLDFCDRLLAEPWIDRPERLRAALTPGDPMHETLNIAEDARLASHPTETGSGHP